MLLDSLVIRLEKDKSGWLDVLTPTSEASTNFRAELPKLTRLITVLKNCGENFVFFFDNIDKLLSDAKPDEPRPFMRFVEQLLEECQNTKVIITCRDVTRQASNEEFSIHVEGFTENRQNAWTLFQTNYGK